MCCQQLSISYRWDSKSFACDNNIHATQIHYCDVIITSLTIVFSTVYSGADHKKHQSSASLAFVRGIHRWPVNSPHKWPVTWKMFPFDDVIVVNHPCDMATVTVSSGWVITHPCELQIIFMSHGWVTSLYDISAHSGYVIRMYYHLVRTRVWCNVDITSHVWENIYMWWTVNTTLVYQMTSRDHQITSDVTVCSTACSARQQRNYQCSWYFMRVILQSPIDSPYQGPALQKTFTYRGAILIFASILQPVLSGVNFWQP